MSESPNDLLKMYYADRDLNEAELENLPQEGKLAIYGTFDFQLWKAARVLEEAKRKVVSLLPIN